MKGKGTLSNLALGVIVTLVCLFIGIYAIAKVTTIFDERTLLDYVYTTVTNNTYGASASRLNNTQTKTVTHYLPTLQQLDSTHGDRFVTVTVSNDGATDQEINITITGVDKGTFTATHNTNSSHDFKYVAFNETAGLGLNTVLAGCKIVSEKNITLWSVVWKYATSNETSAYGGIYENLVTNTSTIFDVMILVIIIAALGVAIAVLRGFGEGEASSSSTI